MPREVGPWARNKLRLLQLYLPGYLQAATRAIDRIYIDGFAGPGLNEIRETGEIIEGSPLIALDAKARDNLSRFTRLHFIEQDPRVVHELREVLHDRDPAGRAEVIHGDVNEVLPTLVRQYSQRAPILVFLDTDAIEPAWRTIERIAPWQTELLINFPLGFALNRNPRSEKVTAYFGTEEWRSISEGAAGNRTRGLLDLYKRRLGELGFDQQVEHDRLISSASGGAGRRFYYLVPASKHPAARTIWDWVFKQPEASGQGRMPL